MVPTATEGKIKLMELFVKIGWGLLALVHAAPAAVLFAPDLTQRLYGVPPDGTAGLLLVHRGALFLAVVAVTLYAAAAPDARRAASLVVGISIVALLALYAKAGFPAGQLRTIAVADGLALLPLVLVAVAAWRR